MKTICKYVLNSTNVQMPKGAKILTIQSQKGVPCIWAEVDQEANPETRIFSIRGTGHIFNEADRGEYIGSIQELDGALIWHIYESTPKKQEEPKKRNKDIDLREAEETLRKVTGYEASCVYDDDMGMIDVRLYGVPEDAETEQEIENKIYDLETGKYDGYGAVFLVDVFKGKKPTTGDKAE